MDNLFGSTQNTNGFTSYDLTDIDISKHGGIDFRSHGAQVPTHQRGDPLKQNKFVGSKISTNRNSGGINLP